jgi:glycosyltransferase involved in cell wall biosynthesis
MRVVHAMAGATFGGAEAFFENLVLGMSRAGLEQAVIIRRDARRAALLRAGGIEPIEAPFGGALDFRTGLAFRSLVRRFAPDVVFTSMNRATRFCPRGDFVHAGRLAGYYNLKYYRYCDHLIVATEHIAAYVRDGGWPTERVHVLPNFVPDSPAPAASRAAFDTPAEAPVLLGLGRLHRNKAFDILIEALVRLPEAYLWIGGVGALERDLAEQAARLGVIDRVRFIGWRDDVPALLAAADVFVCSSRIEPFGNIILEAWVHRTPIVSTTASGPASLIEDGRSGLLAPIDDAEALAAAIGRVVDSAELAANLIDGGRASYEAGYTEAAIIRRYLDFYQRITA